MKLAEWQNESVNLLEWQNESVKLAEWQNESVKLLEWQNESVSKQNDWIKVSNIKDDKMKVWN